VSTPSRWTPEKLRRAALDALGDHADARARDALVRGALSLEPSVAAWESSGGRMTAHRVHLLVGPASLGAARAAPAVEDALRAAFAAAIARHDGETLEDLVLGCAWPAEEAPYRDASPEPRPRPDSLRDALVAYLAGGGADEHLAGVVGRARVGARSGAHGATEVLLAAGAEDHEALRGDARRLARLTTAARDVLGDARVRVRVALRRPGGDRQ